VGICSIIPHIKGEADMEFATSLQAQTAGCNENAPENFYT